MNEPWARVQTALRAVVLTGFGLLLAACGPPGPEATTAQIDRIESRFVETGIAGAGRIHALIAGDPSGQRVIFIHGTPGGARNWADFLVNVPDGYEYVAVDRAGFGRSDPADAVTSLRRQAATLAPLLVERGGMWPVLVGHSLGGPVAARMAVDFGDRVGGLVMVAASLDPALEEVQAVQYVARYSGLEYLLSRRFRNANRELMALEPHLRSLQPRLSRIACPVAIVHGTRDPLVPYANVAYMRREMTNADIRLYSLDDRNHFLPWNSKAAIDEAVRAVAGRRHETCGAG